MWRIGAKVRIHKKGCKGLSLIGVGCPHSPSSYFRCWEWPCGHDHSEHLRAKNNRHLGSTNQVGHYFAQSSIIEVLLVEESNHTRIQARTAKLAVGVGAHQHNAGRGREASDL